MEPNRSSERLRSSIWYEHRYKTESYVEDFYYDTQDSEDEISEISKLKDVPNFLSPIEVFSVSPDQAPDEFEDEDTVIVVRYPKYEGTLANLFDAIDDLTREDAFTLVFELVYGLYVAYKRYGYSQRGTLIKENIAYTLDENPRVYEFDGEYITVRGKYHPWIMDTPNRKYDSSEDDLQKDLIMMCRQVLLRINERIVYADRDITDIFIGSRVRRPPPIETCLTKLIGIH